MGDITGAGESVTAVAGVANNFLDKVGNAIGYFDIAMINKSVKAAHKSIIEEITERKDINLIERAAIISNYKTIIKQHKNKVNITEKAIKLLDVNINPKLVDNDWIDYFYDKSKYSSNEEMQNIWAQILAGNFNKPNSVARSVIHTVSIIDEKCAKTFSQLLNFIVEDIDNKELVVLIPYDSNDQYFTDIGLNYTKLFELEKFGLIKIITDKVWDESSKNFKYFNKHISVSGKSEEMGIYVGNVLLTNDGVNLANIIYNASYDEKMLNIMLSVWTSSEYLIKISDINDV